MQVLSKHEFRRSTIGGRKWNWSELLDGQIRQLDESDLAGTKAKSFGGMFRIRASKRGLSAHVQFNDNDGSVICQAVARSANGEPTPAAPVATQKAPTQKAPAPTPKGRKGK